jgi:hypothetical protein
VTNFLGSTSSVLPAIRCFDSASPRPSANLVNRHFYQKSEIACLATLLGQQDFLMGTARAQISDSPAFVFEVGFESILRRMHRPREVNGSGGTFSRFGQADLAVKSLFAVVVQPSDPLNRTNVGPFLLSSIIQHHFLSIFQLLPNDVPKSWGITYSERPGRLGFPVKSTVGIYSAPI